MSATNRNNTRVASDNYPTPSWCVRRLLESGALPDGGAWLEPCAGEGAIVTAIVQSGMADRLVASDVRDCKAALYVAGADHALIDDYTIEQPAADPSWRTYAVAITNPPFSLAEPITRNMLRVADYVAILVRQGWLGHERADWLRTDMPDTYELPERPSFVSMGYCDACGYGCAKTTPGEPIAHDTLTCPRCGAAKGKGAWHCRRATDAADYCWLVWTPERGRTWGRRCILPSTPLEERKQP